jgi:homoserine O-acetyltransferase/O-succinyltransferase
MTGGALLSSAPVSKETRLWRLEEPFALESGEELPGVQLAYRTWGKLASDGDNAVLVCHALTGSADADVWWGGLFGPGKALDPARDFIVCSNVLAGCYGSSGPIQAHPEDGEPWGSRFPVVTIRDMVRLQGRLLDALGVGRLRLVLGPSLGGMQALEWAACFPGRVGAIAPVGVSVRHSAWCIGISESQRQAIYTDPDWQDGRYPPDRPPRRGLAVARMIAMFSYRSWDNFESRFGRRTQEWDGRFAAASYLQYQGEKLYRRFDANTYVRLTQAMDSHDLARGRGECREVLARLAMPALVVSVDSDVLYPPHEQRELAELLPAARYEVLHTPAGHDGFLIETDALGDMLLRFQAPGSGSKRARKKRSSSGS